MYLWTLLIPGLVLPLPWERTLRTALAPDSLTLRATVVLPDTPLRWVFHLPAARFDPVLRVNGRSVPLPGDDYLPRRVDITAFVNPGRNVLTLTLHSWTSRLVDPPEWLKEARDWIPVRRRVKNQARAPIGGRFFQYGLFGKAFISGHAGAFVEDVQVWTFFPDSLVVEVTLSDSAPVRAEIRKGETLYWRFHGRGKKIRRTWVRPNLAPWWPDTPRLYTLRVLSPGETARVAVGWRGFEAREGLFVLNGQEVVLCGTSFWPSHPPDPGKVRQVLGRIRKLNARIFRTHTRPWDTLWYAMADSMGLLMIPEAALYNDDELYRLDDPLFDFAVRNHHRAMIRTLGRHPSVVMWSLGNELWGHRSRERKYEEMFGKWLDSARALDPTRPVFFEGDGDPVGKSDVIGIHYPLPFWKHLLWPMEGYFLDRPIPVRHWFWPEKTFLWQRRKPLYIGEFLWVPSPTPHLYTVVLGDTAFEPDGWAQAKARLWTWQIEAYRHFRVSGFAPWSVNDAGLSILDDTPLFLAQQDACKPVRTAFRRFRRSAPDGFYMDTLEVFHDVFHGEVLRLLVSTDRTVLLDTLLDLPPFSHRDLPLRAYFPPDETPRREMVEAVLYREGVEVDRRMLAVDVFSAGGQHPSWVWPRDRERMKAPGRFVVRLHRVPPWGTWLEAPASLVHVWAPHPLVQVFPQDFYSLWGTEGISARGMVDPPPSPYVLPLLGAGRPRGMKAVVLLEARKNGAVLWHTLDDTAPEGRVWVELMHTALDTLRLPEGLTVWPGPGDLSAMFQIPYEGSTAVWLRPHPKRMFQIKKLSRYVREGGRVFVERPTVVEARMLGLELEEEETTVRRTDHPLARWLLREHLKVYAQKGKVSWRRAREKPVADRTFLGGIPLTDPPAVVTVPWGKGFWVVSGLKSPRDVPVLQQAYLDILRMLLWAPEP